MAEELKPCPFCGVRLVERRRPMNPKASCKTDGCMGASLPVLPLDDPNAVARWNLRFELALPDADVLGQAASDFFAELIGADGSLAFDPCSSYDIDALVSALRKAATQ